MAMKPNRVSYGSKYAVQLRVPRKAPTQVVCEFAWQAEQVVDREKKNRDNMVHGAEIVRTRHAQPMERWTFDAEEVRWHSVYARNSKANEAGLTDAQRKILVKLDEDLADLGFPDQVEDLLSGGWDDSIDSYLRAGKSDVFGFHFRHAGEEEDRHIYEQAEQLWDDARAEIRALPKKNPASRRLSPTQAAKGDKVQFVYRGRLVTGKVVRVKKDGTRTVELDDNDYFDEAHVDVRSSAPKRYVLVNYEFDRSVNAYTIESEEPVSLQEFIDANAHDEEVMDEMKKILALPVGGEVKFGGGAAPLTAIRRVS